VAVVRVNFSKLIRISLVLRVGLMLGFGENPSSKNQKNSLGFSLLDYSIHL
jgi:hypothetical protein